jgi:hypothetical protein
MPNKNEKLREIIKATFGEVLRENISLTEQTYTVYHGTNDKFDTFDINKTADGVFWFTDSLDSIKKQTHGGAGSKYIMKRKITLNNPAGWDEYEKYSVGELINMGYDGVVLPEDDKADYIVFNPKSISMVSESLNENNLKPEEIIDITTPDKIKQIGRFFRNRLLEEKNNNVFIYHGTGKGQALNIQKNGFMKPSNTGEEHPSISFSGNLDYAKYYAKAKGGHNMVILRTKMNDSFKLSPRIIDNKGFEYVTFNKIPSYKLEILTHDGSWQPLNKWDVIFDEPL